MLIAKIQDAGMDGTVVGQIEDAGVSGSHHPGRLNEGS